MRYGKQVVGLCVALFAGCDAPMPPGDEQAHPEPAQTSATRFDPANGGTITGRVWLAGRPTSYPPVSGAIVQPDGKITQEAGLFRPALLRARLPLATGETPYARYGSAIEMGIGAGALLFALAALIPVRVRKEGES